jgi:Tfp pilus assembly protein PilF
MFAKAFLGASVFNQASWANAEQYFDQAIGLEPNNIYHHLDLAETLVDSRSAGRAVTHLELVAQLPLGCDPADPSYKQQAAELLRRISRQ